RGIGNARRSGQARIVPSTFVGELLRGLWTGTAERRPHLRSHEPRFGRGQWGVGPVYLTAATHADPLGRGSSARSQGYATTIGFSLAFVRGGRRGGAPRPARASRGGGGGRARWLGA